ncbi:MULTISPECIES: MarR family winged helix-turn-helix transcriptional regulator [Clostridium]|uniref:MarR family transcriptional regulator n=2 Tax=Clostridium intestinale TaxID=36845 RepID=A0A7D6W1H7_9CLOT|nr:MULTISPECIES: MarR family transcriptional regulator [Clostridium]QLY80525.1 MarR family transcriptional regulator [Clostridium intestinale]WRY51187.1 MarR family transcriptional regulator [Clostridium intestinale]SHI12662.1 DNA-binding transcriptional regulator, MarR family [Clostridium intestinale DSM 6191]
MDNNIGTLINRSSKLLKNKINISLENLGLTAVQWSVLKDIYNIEELKGDIEELTPLEIGRRLNLDKATLSGVINRLINKEWIEKIKNPKDKRSFYLLLTQKALYNMEELEQINNETIKKAAEGLSSQEIKLLEKYLETFIKNLDNE